MGTMATAQEIADRLAKSERVYLPASRFGVRVEDGVATLTGWAGSLREKKIATVIASEVPGVRLVQNLLKVDDGSTPGDQDIAERIGVAFEADPYLKESDLRVAVSEGEVTLTGRVNSIIDKKLAEATVWWLRGVRDVINEIQVVPDEPDSDDSIEEACRVVLEKDTLVDQTNIWLGVADGVASLSGAVPTEEQRDAAEFDVWSVPGVRDVVNLVRVVAV